MSTIDLSQVTWKKSSFSGGSGSSGQCVEVAALADGRRAVRDSKDPDGAAIVVGAEQFRAFLRGVGTFTS